MPTSKLRLNSTTERLSHKVLKNEKGQCEHEDPGMQTELKKNTAEDSRIFNEDLSSELSEYDNGFELDSNERQYLPDLMKTTAHTVVLKRGLKHICAHIFIEAFYFSQSL